MLNTLLRHVFSFEFVTRLYIPLHKITLLARIYLEDEYKVFKNTIEYIQVCTKHVQLLEGMGGK